MNKTMAQIIDTPWKAASEIFMYALYPFATLYVKAIKKVDIKEGYKFYGMPKILRHRGSSIKIGKNFEDRNNKYSNPLGVNHATIICTWSKDALIEIGDDVGISGGTIVASEGIKIGDGTIIGANCTIIDTDFHPLKSPHRRYSKKDIRSAKIKIGKNVFIGTGAIILKGVEIKDNTIVPAGKVVR